MKFATSLTAVLAVMLGVLTFSAATAAPAAAAGPSTVDISGHGWGHGRGMGQHGAYGYARYHGWTTEQILDHYYGGTHPGTVGQASSVPVNPDSVRVNLVAMNEFTDVRVLIGAGSTPALSGASGHSVPPTAKAIRLVRNSAGKWGIYSSSSASCNASWTSRGTGSSQVTVKLASGNDQLRLCRPDGLRSYPGWIRAYYDGNKTRTLNITTIENYLRGVVPREMPASWGDPTKPWQLRPLEVQAIAARSYALSGDSRHTAAGGGLYADTCDTTMCQVYNGHATNGTPETDHRTDAAIAGTAGEVRLHDGSNIIARTEFSSSTGGYTAGGPFPAVPDLGDDNGINSRHDWTLTRSVAPLEAQCGSDFLRLEVTQRNGLGQDGGRVVKAKIVCSGGSVERTGDQIRQYLGLYSNWWSPACDGDILEYVGATYELFLGRTASNSERQFWCDRITVSGRKILTNALSTSDEWAGKEVDDLYRHVLDREPDSGRQAWLDAIRGGMRLEDVAAGFYGSTEYFQQSGSTLGGYVDNLYLDLLGRPADDGGRRTWVNALEAGNSRRWVAEQFYGSYESRRDRVTRLYVTILGREPDSNGLRTWTSYLKTQGDIVLAASLAASREYFLRVT